MDRRNAERHFVYIINQIDKEYKDECNMCIDVFLEEEFTREELKRMLAYLLEKVSADRYDMVKERLEKEFGSFD